MKGIKIFNINIHNISFKEAIEKLEEYLRGDCLRTIYTPNPEIVMRARDDENLRRILASGDLVTADGIGLIYASKIKKKPLKERVTGFDLSIKMLEIANREGYSIYLLGGKDGVAKEASRNIEKNYPNVKIAGYHHGYFKGVQSGHKDHEDELKIRESINNSRPDIIFVGLGFPNQELWIDGNKDKIYGKVIIGNGGVMDILSGNVKRAPDFFQRLGLEWFYRLLTNPSRIKRQLVLPKFMIDVIIKQDSVL